MDENTLKELYVYDTINMYNTINIQCAFYCFYNYSEKRILELIDNDDSFESILQLYEQFLETSLHSHISQLLEHLDEFENLENYIMQLGRTLNVALQTDNEELQTKIAKFLDSGVYNFFKNTIPDTELFYTEDNILNIEKLKNLLKTDTIEAEDIEAEALKEQVIQKAFRIRKKTLRKKNITPMKSKTKYFKNKSIKK
jgi:vacuolar-type H+-ATPase catalytic subunit A/Vma1